MKIRTKLLIGFSTLLCVMLVLSVLSYDRLKFMNDQLDRVYSERYLKVRNSSGMRGQVNELYKELSNTILNGDTTKNNTTRVKTLVDNANRYFDIMLDSENNLDEQLIIKQVEKSWNEYIAYQDRQLEMLATGDIEAANIYRNNVGLTIQNEVLNNLNSLSAYQDLQVEQEVKDAHVAYERSLQITTSVMVVGLLLSLLISLWILPSISRGLNTVSLMINSFGRGKLKAIQRIKVASTDEIGEVAKVFQTMSKDLEEKQRNEEIFMQSQQEQMWIKTNLARITDLLHGVNSLDSVSQMFINEFTPILGGHYGAVYIRDEERNPEEIYLAGTYAKDETSHPRNTFKIGEGLVGQCALDCNPIRLQSLPDNYVSVRSAFGESQPTDLMIYPVLFEDELLAVIEVAKLDSFSGLEEQLLSELSINLGIVLNNVIRRLRVEELLRESQALAEELQCQSEELQTQQEELRRSNENLEKQTSALRRSEELLQRQQEELEHFNTELIAKTRALEEQVQEVEEKNDEIEKTKDKLQQQAVQLTMTSKYKSEFLANMSHELRTPLNSMLILSQLLSEDKDDNLTPKQKEYAHTIFMSGGDLLKMIDEILDLSKVDAGKMEINQEYIRVSELQTFVNQNFLPVANENNVELTVEIEDGVPNSFQSDGHRVKQILRNLLSNACKFTAEGNIQFTVGIAKDEELPFNLDSNQSYLALSVKDSGIGIPKDKKDLIFEAFQQVDGTTSRKYGGTGLGLSISRGLASLLGGAIAVHSEEGQGSTFTLYLPRTPSPLMYVGQDQVAATTHSIPLNMNYNSIEVSPKDAGEVPQLLIDDRLTIGPGDKVLLIIEDDINFANILVDMSRSHGFKTLAAVQGDTGLQMARTYLPTAIILDIQLPVIDGWSILNELKTNSETRHIPVHVISVVDDIKQGLKMGAIAYLKKPSSKDALERAFSHIESYMEKSVKQLLIVEDDEVQRNAIIELIGHDDVSITAVSTGEEAKEVLLKQHFDCMVLDLMLTDMTGYELLDQIRDDEQLRDLPIIIYTGKELDNKEEMKLRQYAESIIIKDVKSPERLLDETTLFLHRVEANLPEDKRRILRKLYNKEELFEDKKILLVDDDVRNLFALSSVLEGYRMNVIFAENGREAIELLEENPDIDLILMDMMMPEMDGYEAMRLIREQPQYDKLPIIALTAKAMKDDRFKCIEAGASDYMKKPIQTDQLLSLMRVWLYS